MVVVDIEVISDIVCVVTIALTFSNLKKAREKLTLCTSLVVLHWQTNFGQSHLTLPKNLSGRQR